MVVVLSHQPITGMTWNNATTIKCGGGP